MTDPPIYLCRTKKSPRGQRGLRGVRKAPHSRFASHVMSAVRNSSSVPYLEVIHVLNIVRNGEVERTDPQRRVHMSLLVKLALSRHAAALYSRLLISVCCCRLSTLIVSHSSRWLERNRKQGAAPLRDVEPNSSTHVQWLYG